jgi:transitional endoplasmic reticulum ATPase
MPENAVVLALRAALRAADEPEVRVALGQQLLHLGRPSEALEEFEAALQHDSANTEVLELASQAALSAGDPPKAEALRIALEALRKAAPRGTAAAQPMDRTAGAVEGTDRGTKGLPGQDTHRRGEDGADATLLEDAPRLRVVARDGELVDFEEPRLTFSDVGGLDELKKRLDRSFLQPLRKPGLFQRFGKKVGGGLLMYGPPGCGKTFLARALSGEIGARLMVIGLSDVMDMYIGESERKLHEIFQNARRNAPAVLFFDEVDALGRRRSQLRESAGRNIVNQFLNEMDGAQSSNEGVFVLGATNQPWDVDPAMRRPGRFDRTVFVPPPDAEARLRILELKLVGRPSAPSTNLRSIAAQTSGFSGADLQALVDEATELAIAASLESDHDVPISDSMLREALGTLKASTRQWFDSARNYAVYSNEGGAWDDLLDYLRNHGLA